VDTSDVNLHFHTLQSSSGFKTLFPYYIRGARTIIADPHNLEDPVGVLSSALASEGVTGILLHGSIFRRWIRGMHAMQPEDRVPIVSRLRRVMTSLVGPDTLDRATEVIGPSWCHTYGSTEQGSPVTALFAHDLDAWGGRGTVGRLQLPTGELRIVDAEWGNPLPSGTIGEIEVRGEMSLGRYLPSLDRELPINTDDWLRVGDLGLLDAQGALHFIGRSKDMIRIGTRELSPWPVEQRLLETAGVDSCAVIGGTGNDLVLHVLVQLSKHSDEFSASGITGILDTMIDEEISWELHLVPLIPTAEGGVKVDRQAARRLVVQKP
jgi:acyl-CoA synthetase (AMP-forming)/AMP-acid ligase II